MVDKETRRNVLRLYETASERELDAHEMALRQYIQVLDRCDMRRAAEELLRLLLEEKLARLGSAAGSVGSQETGVTALKRPCGFNRSTTAINPSVSKVKAQRRPSASTASRLP